MGSEHDQDGHPPQQERPSRSARKRNAEALQRLGERLLALKPQQLQRFDLPPASARGDPRDAAAAQPLGACARQRSTSAG